MTLLELKAYFENYAKLHVELKHNPAISKDRTFFCMNTEENTDEFIRICNLDLMSILLVPDRALNKTGSENWTFNKHIAFLVLKRVQSAENDNIINAQNTCELIINDFVTRLIADRGQQIKSLNDDSLTIHPIGPMGQNHYGFMLMFSVVDWFDQRINPARWTS